MAGRNEAARRVADAGAKIGGARKDFHARAMTLDDLASMTPAECAQLVTKDNAWPAPDYEALVAQGMGAEAAALVKVVRDRLPRAPTAPAGSWGEQSWRPAELVEHYVRFMAFARDATAACVSAADVRAAFAKVRAHFRHARYRPLDGLLARPPAGEPNSQCGDIRIGLTDRKKADRLLEQGFPAAIPAWRRNAVVRGSAAGGYTAFQGGSVVGRGLPSAEAAWALLEASYETGRGRGQDEAPMPSHPHLDRIERTGRSRRRGHVTPQEFIDAFGYRGTEFGLWLGDDERQKVLDMAFDACDDLALLLGVAPEALSLQGTLAIAFGARGKGSASAHYEPGRRVINATRLSGAGKVAHEWAHAFDHHLGTEGHEDGMERGGARYATGGHEHAGNTRAKALPLLDERTVRALDAVMHAIRWRPDTEGEMRREVAARIARHGAAAARARATLALAEVGRAGPKRDRKIAEQTTEAEMHDRLAARHAALLADLDAGLPVEWAGRKPTSYLREAVKLSGRNGNYWQRPIELFARAFEAWAFDRLEASGERSEYLVHGVEGDRFAGPAWRGNPYPTDGERTRINAAMDELVDAAADRLGRRWREPEEIGNEAGHEGWLDRPMAPRIPVGPMAHTQMSLF